MICVKLGAHTQVYVAPLQAFVFIVILVFFGKFPVVEKDSGVQIYTWGPKPFSWPNNIYIYIHIQQPTKTMHACKPFLPNIYIYISLVHLSKCCHTHFNLCLSYTLQLVFILVFLMVHHDHHDKIIYIYALYIWCIYIYIYMKPLSLHVQFYIPHHLSFGAGPHIRWVLRWGGKCVQVHPGRSQHGRSCWHSLHAQHAQQSNGHTYGCRIPVFWQLQIVSLPSCIYLENPALLSGLVQWIFLFIVIVCHPCNCLSSP